MHTVGDARQTTAGIDGADAEKLGGYFPNLNAIAAELLADARNLVVWAAPRIPAANKGEALRRCLAEVDAATCSRAFADVDPTPLTCVPSY